MNLYRISKKKFIDDLSGEGARLYGGRWNLKGEALIYTSETRSLAALEFLVHNTMIIAPPNLSIMTINVPDNIKPIHIDAGKLPPAWKMDPAPEAIAKIGSEWIQSNSSLLLKVPSVLVDEEYNFLINPNHKDRSFLKVVEVKSFTYDERLGTRKQ